MKKIFLKIFFLSLILSLPVSVYAGGPGIMMIGGGVNAAAPACGDSSCTGFLFCQNLETATTGWDNGETWTTNGTVDPAYTTSPLRGSQSCSIADSSYIQRAFGGSNTTVYLFGRFKFGDGRPSTTVTILKGYHGTSEIASVSILTSGKLYCAHGTVNNSSAATFADGASGTYYIWFKMGANSGATDGVMKAWASTSPTDPGEGAGDVHCEVTAGNDADTPIDTVRYMSSAAGGLGLVVDQLLGKTTAIGTVCE